MGTKGKVLIAKIGLDVHDTGSRVVSEMLKNMGIEVVYLGLFNTPEGVVRAAMDEDVDIVGISYHESSYLSSVSDLLESLKQKGSRAEVVLGGIIKIGDVLKLKEMGVAEVFLPGTPQSEIEDYFSKALALAKAG